MNSIAMVLALLAVLGSAACAQDRVIIIGVDGMDHALTRDLMEAGELPALAALARAGSFKPLLPTNPAQSPTSWATLTTGCNPGATGVFGFLRRSILDGKVVPELALVAKRDEPGLTSTFRTLTILAVIALAAVPMLILRRKKILGLGLFVFLAALILVPLLHLFSHMPKTVPLLENLRSAESMWVALDKEGVSGLYLDAPCAFPAPQLDKGHLLCGLGVPDMLGTMGSVAVFRDGPVAGGVRTTPMGGREVALVRSEDGSRLTGANLEGPLNPLDGKRARIPLTFARLPGEKLRLDYQDLEADLPVERFTGFLPVAFDFSSFMRVKGLVRFRVMRGGERPIVYQEPVQFDPRYQVPSAPITSSPEFGQELAQGGLFETAGWATATNPYTDELIDDATVIEDIESVATGRHRRVGYALVRGKWRVFFAVLSTPDRVQHIFWRDRDKDHPAHDAEGAKRRGDQVLKAYRKVDDLIGRIHTKVMRQGDVLLVVSDHGFAPWRFSLNINRWLAENGYLVGSRDGRRTLAAGVGKPVFEHIDWSRTRAYSLGLGRIWLNLEGREPGGIVKPHETDGLMKQIRQGLLALTHEGRSVVRTVKRAGNLYAGARISESADLIVGFERGYRVSWDSCLGGLDEPTLAPNLSRWSGDHCSVDPALVPGVLFSSRKLEDRESGVADIYPTVRAFLGLAPAEGLDGTTLWRSSK